MTYPFSMYGRIIQVYRYEVSYQEERFSSWETEEGGLPTVTEERKAYLNTLDQAEAVAAAHEGSTLIKLDSSAYEWLDGIEVPDVSDTYSEAVKLYEMGKEAYEKEKNKPSDKEVISMLETQVTDLQMALCDMYETMEVTT